MSGFDILKKNKTEGRYFRAKNADNKNKN